MASKAGIFSKFFIPPYLLKILNPSKQINDFYNPDTLMKLLGYISKRDDHIYYEISSDLKMIKVSPYLFVPRDGRKGKKK